MTDTLAKKIQDKSSLLGISSEEVSLAKALFVNRKYDYRGETRLFICEGLWAAEKLAESKITVTHFLFDPEKVTDEEEADVSLMLDYAEESFTVSAKVCAKISDRDGADHCFIVARLPEYKLEDIRLSDEEISIVLDGQEQPGNVGAILRSLDGAGGSFAVMTNRRVKLTHSRLVRASLGAVFTMKVVEADADELAKWLVDNHFKIVVTDLKATYPYYEADYSGRVAIVAGNEYNGVSPLWNTLPGATPVIIPMLGKCESLNVGFASTLVAYEAAVQKMRKRR